MSFRIADLIGDKPTSAADKPQTGHEDVAKNAVSSTSEEYNYPKIQRAVPQDSSTLNHRLGTITNSSFNPGNLVNTDKVNSVPFLHHDSITSKLELSTYEDYASKLYSSIYYDQLYLQPSGMMPNANSGLPTYGLHKSLSAAYPALYSRSRPGWPGMYPTPAQTTLTHHPLSPFFSPLVYAHYSKRKGGQVRFTTSQTDTLEKRFQSHKYLSPEDRRVLADALKLSDRQVKTWFQNRRAKWRRCHDGSERHSEGVECHSSDSEPDQTTSLSPDHQINITN